MENNIFNSSPAERKRRRADIIEELSKKYGTSDLSFWLYTLSPADYVLLAQMVIGDYLDVLLFKAIDHHALRKYRTRGEKPDTDLYEDIYRFCQTYKQILGSTPRSTVLDRFKNYVLDEDDFMEIFKYEAHLSLKVLQEVYRCYVQDLIFLRVRLKHGLREVQLVEYEITHWGFSIPVYHPDVEEDCNPPEASCYARGLPLLPAPHGRYKAELTAHLSHFELAYSASHENSKVNFALAEKELSRTIATLMEQKKPSQRVKMRFSPVLKVGKANIEIHMGFGLDARIVNACIGLGGLLLVLLGFGWTLPCGLWLLTAAYWLASRIRI